MGTLSSMQLLHFMYARDSHLMPIPVQGVVVEVLGSQRDRGNERPKVTHGPS